MKIGQLKIVNAFRLVTAVAPTVNWEQRPHRIFVVFL